jgi:hypothetical protein
MEPTNEEYFMVLIDFFEEPESVKKFIKACIKANAVNKDQFQSLLCCAEEVLQYLNGMDILGREPNELDHFWYQQAHAMGYERFEVFKDKIRSSMRLLEANT